MRLMIISLVACLASMIAAPAAQAAAPNGFYQLSAGAGSLTVQGKTIKFPKELFKELISSESVVLPVRKNSIEILAGDSSELIDELGDALGFGFEGKITGPDYLYLKKKGSIFQGTTKIPVVIKFNGTIDGEQASGTVKLDVTVKIMERRAALDIRISGKLNGIKLNGKVNLVFNR